MAFPVKQIQDLVPSRSLDREMPNADPADDLIDTLGRLLEAAGMPFYGSFDFELALVFMMMLHVQRAAVTQAALGANCLNRMALVWPVCVATFARTFLGLATAWGQLRRLADGGRWFPALDAAAFQSHRRWTCRA